MLRASSFSVIASTEGPSVPSAVDFETSSAGTDELEDEERESDELDEDDDDDDDDDVSV